MPRTPQRIASGVRWLFGDEADHTMLHGKPVTMEFVEVDFAGGDIFVGVFGKRNESWHQAHKVQVLAPSLGGRFTLSKVPTHSGTGNARFIWNYKTPFAVVLMRDKAFAERASDFLLGKEAADERFVLQFSMPPIKEHFCRFCFCRHGIASDGPNHTSVTLDGRCKKHAGEYTMCSSKQCMSAASFQVEVEGWEKSRPLCVICTMTESFQGQRCTFVPLRTGAIVRSAGDAPVLRHAIVRSPGDAPREASQEGANPLLQQDYETWFDVEQEAGDFDEHQAAQDPTWEHLCRGCRKQFRYAFFHCDEDSGYEPSKQYRFCLPCASAGLHAGHLHKCLLVATERGSALLSNRKLL